MQVKETGTVSTIQFVGYVLAIAVGATLYVGHVHATDELLRETQVNRQANLDLNLQLNRLQGTYDLETAPDAIYPKATELGLVEGFEYGKTITIESSDSHR